MYYYPVDEDNPVHPEYVGYGNPFVRKIADSEKNLLIVPEVFSGIELLRSFFRIQKIIWWLSVDNFITSYVSSRRAKPVGFFPSTLLEITSRVLRRFSGFDIGDLTATRLVADIDGLKALVRRLELEKVNLHLAQSYYALDFLRSLGFRNVAYLSDYVNTLFLEQSYDVKMKEDIVVFNPKKGLDFTRRIMRALPHVSFVAIEHMGRREVIELLKRAKVYIDFGNHPGKDRLPREAAVLGCCVLVGRRGSAQNAYDVPIPEKYKFERENSAIPLIAEMIKYCLVSYEEAHRDFEGYRAVIRQEPKRFLADLLSVFGVGASSARTELGSDQPMTDGRISRL